MSAKPATVPTWNTGGTNRTTPSGGQQVTGFATGDQVPSGWMNWFFYWAFAWIRYLADGAFSATSGAAVYGESTDTTPLVPGIEGQNNSASGVGVSGSSTGAGGIGMFGQGNLAGGYFGSTAAGGIGIQGLASGAGGFGVVGTAQALSGTTSSAGVVGNAAEIPNSDGVRGILRPGSSNAQAGVLGDGSACGGYGVTALGDTTSPARAALRIVPQDLQPSSPQEGDVYFNSVTHLSYRYNGSIWIEFATAYRVRTVANFAALPSGVIGDLALTTATGKLYVYDGAAWTVVGTQT